jgi:DNA-binding LytR/AlgR family response regulator
MKVLIIEDEHLAAQQLKDFVENHDETVIVGMVNSCTGLRRWVQEGGKADLVFCDIELSDGNVLPVLKELRLDAAIIFTTAYDNFWSEALKLNGIEYLLKPITREKVAAALTKASTIKKVFARDDSLLSRLESMVKSKGTTFYKKRFPVRINNELFVVEADAVAFFRIMEGVIMAFTDNGKKYPLTEETLNDLEAKLDPELFYRINRSEIIHAQFIHSIKIGEGNEYCILVKGIDQKLSVSNSRLAQFKEWLEDPRRIGG